MTRLSQVAANNANDASIILDWQRSPHFLPPERRSSLLGRDQYGQRPRLGPHSPSLPSIDSELVTKGGLGVSAGGDGTSDKKGSGRPPKRAEARRTDANANTNEESRPAENAEIAGQATAAGPSANPASRHWLGRRVSAVQAPKTTSLPRSSSRFVPKHLTLNPLSSGSRSAIGIVIGGHVSGDVESDGSDNPTIAKGETGEHVRGVFALREPNSPASSQLPVVSARRNEFQDRRHQINGVTPTDAIEDSNISKRRSYRNSATRLHPGRQSVDTGALSRFESRGAHDEPDPEGRSRRSKGHRLSYSVGSNGLGSDAKRQSLTYTRLGGNCEGRAAAAASIIAQAGHESRREKSQSSESPTLAGPDRAAGSRPAKAAMPYDVGTEMSPAKDHSRTRSQGSRRGESSQQKGKGGKQSQKAMLSRALQKANTAVQLDNAQNFDGARLAYLEACDLLQQVLQRTSADEDKRKLEAIRKTYTSRIEDLDQMGTGSEVGDDKALPARPGSIGYPPSTTTTITLGDDDDEDIAIIETATLTRMGPSTSPVSSGLRSRQLQSNFSRPSRPGDDPLASRRNDSTGEKAFVPPPLSPGRGEAARNGPDVEQPDGEAGAGGGAAGRSAITGGGVPHIAHIRGGSRGGSRGGGSQGSNFWLESKAESNGSRTSSVRSQSSLGTSSSHARGHSAGSEGEFDAALDAAVEAAYGDSFDVANSEDEGNETVVAQAMRRVEVAKERVRQSERETLEMEHERELRRNEQQSRTGEDFYDDNSSDDEQRMLEEMTRGYEIEDFSFSSRQGGPVPGESDSSSTASRTWLSSSASNPPTATSLSTFDEGAPGGVGSVPNLAATSKGPPNQYLPDLPKQSSQDGLAGLGTTQSTTTTQSVRNRRLSGQNPKQLKIETSSHRSSMNSVTNGTEGMAVDQMWSSEGPGSHIAMLAEDSPTEFGGTQSSPLHYSLSYDDVEVVDDDDDEDDEDDDDDYEDGERHSRVGSTSRFAHFTLRDNYSTSSLRSAKSRNRSLSHLDDGSDRSPGTPSSNNFGSTSKLPLYPSIPTPIAAAFREQVSADAEENVSRYLSDGNFQNGASPGSPLSPVVDAPVSLEPCPSDFMLRPFWLMRCLYQTLAHSRGGYLSSKLFVPRDVWTVKGVKLRNVEDKIATCDHLTDALVKLGRVDTCDADAVLEEMQMLEGVLEQMTASLTRKLGSEVGVHSPGHLFKESNGGGEPEPTPGVPRSASVSAKSSAPFSWRRLRVKNSTAGFAGSVGGKSESGKESPTLETLPMTDHPTSRPAKRVLGLAQFSGPHANYMESLAKLFDAAQTLDQIARQVEDPGLRHADKTQVGLELCTRHAAEFFAFYICRFVLADLNVLLEKFIKKGADWVST